MKGYLQIGHTRKTYGTEGALKLVCQPAYEELLPKLRAVFFEVQGGPVPFFIAEVRGGSNPTIRFEDVQTPEEAKMLAGLPIYARPEDLGGGVAAAASEAPSLPEQLRGLLIHDRERGQVGEIVAVVETPEQLLAAVPYQGQERLIPLHDELILDYDAEAGILYMDLPEGLLEL